MSIFEARKVMLQTILTLLVLTACIVYAIARIRKAVHAPSDPCAGCTGCRLREELREKADCPHKTAHCLQKKRSADEEQCPQERCGSKKSIKKFGRTE